MKFNIYIEARHISAYYETRMLKFKMRRFDVYHDALYLNY
jgi:hypothetical protein